MTSTRSASRVTSAAPMSVPSSMRPEVSRVGWTWIGRQTPASLSALRTPLTAAFSSRMSWPVSMSSTSTPPSMSPAACSRNASASSSYVTWPSVGSEVLGR